MNNTLDFPKATPEPSPKRIEFVATLDSRKEYLRVSEVTLEPSFWDNIILLIKGNKWIGESYDVMLAYSNSGNQRQVYLGNWNDGVK